MFAAASAQVPVVVPPPPVTNSIVIVPDTDTNEIEGSLENLGEVASEFIVNNCDIIS